jgi:hypothetical protein
MHVRWHQLANGSNHSDNEATPAAQSQVILNSTTASIATPTAGGGSVTMLTKVLLLLVPKQILVKTGK